MAKRLLPRGVEELRAYASTLTIGGATVVDVDVRLDEDSGGDEAVFLDVVLTDPPSDAETWPLDDVLALYRTVDEKAIELGIDRPWHVVLTTAGDEDWDLDE